MLAKLPLLVSLLAALAPAAPVPSTAAANVAHQGEATVYQQFNTAGSCGTVHSDADHVVALSPAWLPANAYCGRKMQATNARTGKKIEVVIADTCPSCPENNVDFSVGAWDALTDGEAWGRIDLLWKFCDENGVC